MFYFKQFIREKWKDKKYSVKDSVKVSENTLKKETANRNHYELNTNVEFYVTIFVLKPTFFGFCAINDKFCENNCFMIPESNDIIKRMKSFGSVDC
jgi:hypothetical protein